MKEIDLKMALNRKLFYSTILLFFLIICCSYNQKEIFYQYQGVKDAKWEQSKDFVFMVDSTIIDSTQKYNIWLELMHNSSYKYQNLWVNFSIKAISDSVIEERISKEFIIADEDGLWQGAGFGSSYQITLPVMTAVSLSDKGRVNYEFRLSSGMTDGALEGIEQVGLRIDRID